jgi:hypothetical protein
MTESILINIKQVRPNAKLKERFFNFATDGLISNQKSIDTLLHNISRLNLIDLRNILKNRYSSLGHSVKISNFEKYIGKFQEKHNDLLYTSFTYPENVMDFDRTLPNILVPSDTVFKIDRQYTIAAITPLYKSLNIKVNGIPVAWDDPSKDGWHIINDYPDGFTFISQRQNALMTKIIYVGVPGTAAIIEYYEDSETPTFSKKIRWE